MAGNGTKKIEKREEITECEKEKNKKRSENRGKTGLGEIYIIFAMYKCITDRRKNTPRLEQLLKQLSNTDQISQHVAGIGYRSRNWLLS